MRVICYDLDSTLFDVHHREHLAPPEEDRGPAENWIEYSKGCINDTVVEGVAESARLFSEAGYRIAIVSGRNVEAREETISVLKRYNVPWDILRLQTSTDIRHNGEYKVQFIQELFDQGLHVSLMFEDHISVCEVIESRTGVPCITVRPRYEDGVGVSFNQASEVTA